MKWLKTSTVEKSHPERWSAVIPAAGKGSRLKFSGPKILYPISGRPILHWLLDSLKEQVREIILVVDSEAELKVRSHVSIDIPIRYVVQPTPLGMADAVYRGIGATTKEFTWVIWGDQPFVRKEKLKKISGDLENNPLSGIVPLVQKPHPYVNYVIDAENRLSVVHQRREDEPMPEVGFSDLGCFAFRSQFLKDLLRISPKTPGRITREWNFLPELPRLETLENGLGFSLFEDHAPENISINTPEEGVQAAEWLKANPTWNLERI